MLHACFVPAGEQLDGALATLRLLSSRLAALSGMAHEPHSSCSSDPGLTIGTKVRGWAHLLTRDAL